MPAPQPENPPEGPPPSPPLEHPPRGNAEPEAEPVVYANSRNSSTNNNNPTTPVQIKAAGFKKSPSDGDGTTTTVDQGNMYSGYAHTSKNSQELSGEENKDENTREEVTTRMNSKDSSTKGIDKAESSGRHGSGAMGSEGYHKNSEASSNKDGDHTSTFTSGGGGDVGKKASTESSKKVHLRPDVDTDPTRTGEASIRAQNNWKKTQNVKSLVQFKSFVSEATRNQFTRKAKYGPDLCATSLNIFPLKSDFRQRCLLIVETPLFDKVILLLILANSACMAAYRHREVFNKDRGLPQDSMNSIIDGLDPVFLLVFVVECMLKVVAYGLFAAKKTYLRDAWNWLDFIVVLTGILTWFLENVLSVGGGNAGSVIKMLRVFRVMRPLRSLTTMPELKILVNTVLSSIPRLGPVLSMTVFILVMFSILGINFWMGVFDRRCRQIPAVTYDQSQNCWSWPLALDDDGAPIGRPCGGRYMCEDTTYYKIWGEKVCGANSLYDLSPARRPVFPTQIEVLSGVGLTVKTPLEFKDQEEASLYTTFCPNTKLEVKNDGNYNYGLTNFNNIVNAVIVIFQCITLEGWTDIMYLAQDAHNNDFAFIYFLILIVAGSFFLLNVALAVVWEAFQELSTPGPGPAIEDHTPADIGDPGRDTPGRSSDGEPGMNPLISTTAIKVNTDDVNEKGDNGDVPGGSPPSRAESARNTNKVAPEPTDDEADFDLEVAMASISMNGSVHRGRRSSALLVYDDQVMIKPVFDLVATNAFQGFIMSCIVLNIIVMMMDQHPPLKPPVSDILKTTNTVFTIIFGVEMILVLLAIGPNNYVREKWHLFDGFIVISSFYEMWSANGGGAMKSFRLLRILKLAKKWASFRLLLQAVVYTVLSMYNFTVLLILMMFVFSLMGSLIFANKFKFNPDTDEPIPENLPCPSADGSINYGDFSCTRRAHFDYFLWSIVTVLQCLTGENWNAIMYDGMRGAGWAYFIFFFAMVVLGMCIIFNLFLAILMANFQDASDTIRDSEEARKQAEALLQDSFAALEDESVCSDESEDEKEPVTKEEFTSPVRKPKNMLQSYIKRSEMRKAARAGQQNANQTKLDTIMGQKPGSKQASGPGATASGAQPASSIVAPPSTTPPGDGIEAGSGMRSLKVPDERYEKGDTATSPSGTPTASERPPDGEPTSPKKLKKKRKNHNKDKNRSTYKQVNHTTPAVVRFCVYVCTSQWFDNFILSLILISSSCMAFDDPFLSPDHTKIQVLTVMNIVFTTSFLAEMLMKHVAMGVSNYWRNGWNMLDGGVVIISCVDLMFYITAQVSNAEAGSDISFLKTLRVLRALRPLRVIARNPNLKLVVNTIFASLPQLRTLMVLMILFFLIVGLVTVNYLKGAFFACYDTSGGEIDILATRRSMYSSGLIPQTETMCATDCTADECSQGKKLVKSTAAQVPLATGGTNNAAAVAACPNPLESFKRPSEDVPICIAKCPLDGSGLGVCSKHEELKTYLKDKQTGILSSDLPNKCVGEHPWKYHPNNEPPLSWKNQLEYNLMQCTACAARYCPHLKKVSDSCKNYCSDKLIGLCQSSCGPDENGPICQTCRRECEGACECELHCEAKTQDAALCLENGGMWLPSISQSFDNIGVAMITLLEISTTEGWVDVMYAAVDARGVNLQPVRDHTEVWSLFFVFFMLVGCFLILNLCVGVIVDNFAEMKKNQSDPNQSLLVTKTQQKWIQTQKNLATRKMFLSLKNLESYDAKRRNMFFLVNDDRFEGFVMSCIVLNAVVMACKIFPGEDSTFDWETYEWVLKGFNYGFASVFFCEACMKLYAYHLWYFQDSWNVFDFACVCATLIGIILEYIAKLKVGSLLSTMRLFRVARLLRLLRFAKGLNKIFNAFLLSIPKLFNVVGVLFLLMFLFAVMGVQLFAKVQFRDTHDERGNFRTFYRTFMTLVRCMTGEAWNELMHDLARTPDEFGRWDQTPCVASFDVSSMAVSNLLESRCLLENPLQCGDPGMSYVYFVTYTMIITFIVFNLVVAVILEGFEDSTVKHEEEIVNLAIDNWKKYDPDYRLTLDTESAQTFINEIEQTLLSEEEKAIANHIILTEDEKSFLNLQGGADGRISFVAVVQAALRQVMLKCVPTQAERASMMDEILTIELGILDPTSSMLKHESDVLQVLGYVQEQIIRNPAAEPSK